MQAGEDSLRALRHRLKIIKGFGVHEGEPPAPVCFYHQDALVVLGLLVCFFEVFVDFFVVVEVADVEFRCSFHLDHEFFEHFVVSVAVAFQHVVSHVMFRVNQAAAVRDSVPSNSGYVFEYFRGLAFSPFAFLLAVRHDCDGEEVRRDKQPKTSKGQVMRMRARKNPLEEKR